MSSVQLEQIETPVDTSPPEKMWHILDEERGISWALCGRKLTGDTAQDFVDLAEIDCVVCAEMWRD